MIDIHSHLIYNVDDGSKSLEESINILDNYSKNGITDIILTPHYINETKYNSLKSDNVKIFKGLRKELKKNNIDINIYLGNEIYIDNNIFDLIKENKISTLNNTEYVLVELPLNGIYNDYIDIFTSLINEGCKIVLAHPERYTSFQEDYNKILELEELGVLFQCNINSIINKYGNNSKKLFKRLLKDKKVTFLGTDIHKDVKDYSFIKKSIKKISKYVSDDYLNDILSNNAKNIIK